MLNLLLGLLFLLVVLAIVSVLLFPVILLVLSRYLRARRAKHRLNQNQCIHCGYDLRGSKDRCPECGEGFG